MEDTDRKMVAGTFGWVNEHRHTLTVGGGVGGTIEYYTTYHFRIGKGSIEQAHEFTEENPQAP